MAKYNSKYILDKETKENLKILDSEIIPRIWIELVVLILFPIFAFFVFYNIQNINVLLDLSQKYSQLCLSVVIGFAALVFALAVIEKSKEIKEKILFLIEILFYFTIINILLFLASYLQSDIIKGWIIAFFSLSILFFVFIMKLFFNLCQMLLIRK